MKKQLISIIAMAVLVGGGAFYGGMKYVQSQAPQRLEQSGMPGNGPRNGNGGGRFGNRSAGDFTAGEVISKDDKSITVKLRDGGSKIVFFSDTTEISKFTAGNANDLAVGKSVIANGKANSDGSITAQTIQVRPAMPYNTPAR